MIQDMNLAEIARRLEAIQQRLTQLGPMHPGSLGEQYNVCGNPTCRCKAPRQAVRHGPYHQLSYTRKGKSTTRFVRKEELRAVKQQLTNYARFRKLVERWIDLAMEISQLRRRSPGEG